MAFFPEDEPVIRKRILPPFEPFVFDPEAAAAAGHAAIAHLRTPGPGKAERKNTHPFQFRNWTFAMHGTIENFPPLRRELMGELNPEYRRSIQGHSDAEHAFFLFLSYLKRSAGSIGSDAPLHRIRDSFRKTFYMLNEMTGRSGSLIRSQIDALCTNRQVMLACRQRGALYQLERSQAEVCPICKASHAVVAAGEPYHAVVFATEPLSGEDWTEIPDNSVVMVDPDLGVVVDPLEQ